MKSIQKKRFEETQTSTEVVLKMNIWMDSSFGIGCFTLYYKHYWYSIWHTLHKQMLQTVSQMEEWTLICGWMEYSFIVL